MKLVLKELFTNMPVLEGIRTMLENLTKHQFSGYKVFIPDYCI